MQLDGCRGYDAYLDRESSSICIDTSKEGVGDQAGTWMKERAPLPDMELVTHVICWTLPIREGKQARGARLRVRGSKGTTASNPGRNKQWLDAAGRGGMEGACCADILLWPRDMREHARACKGNTSRTVVPRSPRPGTRCQPSQENAGAGRERGRCPRTPTAGMCICKHAQCQTGREANIARPPVLDQYPKARTSRPPGGKEWAADDGRLGRPPEAVNREQRQTGSRTSASRDAPRTHSHPLRTPSHGGQGPQEDPHEAACSGELQGAPE